MIRPTPVDQQGDHDNHDPPGPPGPPDHDMPQAPHDPAHTPDVPLLQHQHTFPSSLAFTQTHQLHNPYNTLRSRRCSPFPRQVESTGWGDVLTPPSRPAQPTVVVPTPKPKDPPLPPQPEDEDDDMSSEHKQPAKKQKSKQEDDSPRNRQSEPASSSDHPLLPIASTGPSIPQTGPSTSLGLPDPKVDQEEEEEDESGTTDSQRTRRYTDEDSDLVIDEALWTQLTHDQKICSNTGSFTVPRDINNQPVSLLTVQVSIDQHQLPFFAHTRGTNMTFNQLVTALLTTIEQS